MKYIKYFLFLIIISACNTSNPNAPQSVDQSQPRGSDKVADSIDKESSSSTDSVDFNNSPNGIKK